ncbi:hypothetical protein AS9A_P20016 (plasmid) [Hoyosella subflava DQS3-9A1]|uniref:Uncharacterized protein n=1 Tax=Hoyosella subflava (strain DSM 45089 / JCM 17490 / NBRC 109087 / DQS3-9A1) TaxID=443218 RepID=F6ESD9_HOYSD|nr:hypothetical protein AS9A_P20016 [Hoyosella subflava DQS3-9A1]
MGSQAEHEQPTHPQRLIRQKKMTSDDAAFAARSTAHYFSV